MGHQEKISKLAARFVIADPHEALCIKRTLSGLSSAAKLKGDMAAYKAYSRAAKRLKTPNRR